jgi:hypothetical protein
MTSVTCRTVANCFVLLMVLVGMLLNGCGRSAEQQAAEEASERKVFADAAAAQLDGVGSSVLPRADECTAHRMGRGMKRG